MNIGQRQKLILASIIEQYIHSGEPVGSKTLCEKLPITVSSATVRNEMSDLTEKGLLEQRHTSGGRVPSALAYRYYVDSLMIPVPLNQWEVNRVNKVLAMNSGDPERLLADTIRLLAETTECVSFYTSVADGVDTVQGVELIPAGHSKAMLVMLTAGGIIKSSVCNIHGDIDEKFRETFYAVVREELVGTPLTQVTLAKVQNLSVTLGGMIFPMINVLTSLCVLCEEASRSEIHVEGETNLLSHEEFGERVYPLLTFLAGKEKLRDLVHTKMNTGKLTEVLIGEECGQYELSGSSILLSKYFYGQRRCGTIGILGSTRIDYQRLMPLFEYITNLTGRLLSERGMLYE